MDSQGGGTPRALVIAMVLAVVAVIGAVALAFVPLGGDSGSDAVPGPTATILPVPPPQPTDPIPTNPFPTDPFPTDTVPTEPTPTTDSYQVVEAPGGLSVSIPASWPVRAGAVASNDQADDPDADCFLRFGGSTADPRPLRTVVAGFERSTTSIQRDYQRLQLAPVEYGQSAAAVDWEFTFTADTGPRHAYGRYWRTAGSDFVVYASCAADDWSQVQQPLSTMFDTATPQ